MSAVYGDSENKEMQSGMVDSLLGVNDLLYKMPPSLSLASQVHYVSSFPQKNTYSGGDVLVLDLQTGSQFIDFCDSYFHFNIVCQANAVGDFGAGSVDNLFDRIVVRSRDGGEICRHESHNFCNSVTSRWEAPFEWFKTTAIAQGYPSLIEQGGYVTGGAAQSDTSGGDGKSTTFAGAGGGSQEVFPMRNIPCFKNSKLWPPQLCEGLRIEFTLANVNTVFYTDALSTANQPTSYTLTGLEFRTKAFMLADQFSRRINEIAAQQGLVLVHNELYRTIISGATAAVNYDFDVRKAASHALKLWCMPRNTNDIQNALTDAMVCQSNSLQKAQSWIGATYYPVQPLTTTLGSGVAVVLTPKTANELYWYSLAQVGANDFKNSIYVNPSQYCSGVSVTSGTPATGSWGVYVQDFNKSQSSASGVMTNNSRALLVQLQFGNTTGAHRIEVFLEHLRSVKAFVSNVEIRD